MQPDWKRRQLETPIGPVCLAVDETGVTFLGFGRWEEPVAQEACSLLDQAERELSEYLCGLRRSFSVPLHPSGTDFQMRVWALLREIPYGRTVSYGEIARRLGNPQAARAVGLANNRNPICIMIPCHRVIGANGNLVGYGGGLPIKSALLELEKRHVV